jgi:hypothetical protein
VVRGPIDAITIKTETIAVAMNRKTPVVPQFLRKKAIKNPTKIVLKRLQE